MSDDAKKKLSFVLVGVAILIWIVSLIIMISNIKVAMIVDLLTIPVLLIPAIILDPDAFYDRKV